MSSHNLDDRFDGTFRQLFDTIERCTEQCWTDRLQTLLEKLGGQLSIGLDVFSEPSNAIRSKLVPDKPIPFVVGGGGDDTFTVTSDEKDIICHFSDMLQLNELHCAILWNAQKKQNSLLLSEFLKQHQEQKQKSLHLLNDYNRIYQLLTQVYFEDRLSLLHSISSLLRLAQSSDDDEQQPYTPIVTDALNNLNDSKNNNDFPGLIFEQFTKLVRTSVPPAFTTTTQLTQVYSQQILKEEKALLEILVVYYISRPCPAKHVLSFYQEFEANGFGTEQSIGSSLNVTGRTMCAEVSYLCGLLSVQLIQQATAMDPTIDVNGLKASPETIISLNYLMTFLGDIKEQSLTLLAWADFLQSLEPLVSQNNGYGKLRNMLDGSLPSSIDTATSCLLSSKHRPKNVHIGRPASSIPTSNRIPVVEYGADLFQRFTARAISLNGFDYINLILSSSQLCNGEDVNKLAYHTILYELLYRFACAVNLSCLNESTHSTVIQDFCLVFGNEPDLCGRFWRVDMDEHSVALSELLLEPETGRFPRKFTDIIQLLISVCGDPSTGGQEQISYVQNVNRYLMPDGWHALMDKLVQFSNGGQDATGLSDVISILRLLGKVLLSSDSIMITDLMKHVEQIRPSSVSTCPFLVSLLCDIVTCNSTVRDCSVEVLTLGIECLTTLLPYYPTHIWSFISQSPLFPCPLESDPLLASNFSKVPTRTLGNRHPAQIDHIIASVECEIGKYSVLLSLLDFIGGLVKDVQCHWWTILNGDPSNEQYKAEIIYGYLHYLLSQVLPYYAGWRYKCVYDRYLIGSKMTALFIEVERFFKFDGTNCDGGNTDTVLTMSKVRGAMLYRFLKDKYAIQFYLSPLLEVMSNGTWMAENLYSTNRIKEAHQAETLTKLTFLFIKSLLQQQLDNTNSIRSKGDPHSGLLETTLLNHRIGNNGKTDFLFRMAQLIRYREPQGYWKKLETSPTIPILATNVISLLSLSVSRWKTVPNFVQYLGDTDQAQSVIKSYLAIANDPSQSESLLTSVWQMITLLVETQPSLALLFMECGDAIMPSPKTAVKLLDQRGPGVKKSTTSTTSASPSAGFGNESGSGTTSNESAVRAAVELLNGWQTLSIEKPTVLSNVLRFLTTFWQSAFDHYAMVQRTRSDNGLWQALEAILFNPVSMDSIGGDLAKEQKQQQEHIRQLLNDVDLDGTNVDKLLFRVQNAIEGTNQSIRRKCCLLLNRAFIMRLVAFEIQLTAGSQMAQGIKLTTNTAVVGDKLPAGLKNLLFKMGESKKLEWMRLCFIRNGFDPTLTRQVHEDAYQVLGACSFTSGHAEDMAPLLLQMVTNVGFGDDVNNGQGQGRQYGASYLYDFPLAVSRISSLYHNATQAQREHIRRQQQSDNGGGMALVTPQVQAVRSVKQVCMQFVADICVANFNWSLVDTEMMQLQSFKTAMETSSGHVPDVIWHTKTKSTLYPFINDLVDQAIKDDENATARQSKQSSSHHSSLDTPQDGVALTSHQNVVNLIRAVTEDWINSKRTLIMDKSISQQQLQVDYIKEAVSLVLKLCQLLERENFALYKNGLGSTVYHRPLLESILLCIRTVHTSSSNHTVAQLGGGDLKDALIHLLRVTCASFSGVVQHAMAQQKQQGSTTAVPDDKTEECIKDVTVVLALLGELVKSNEHQENIIPVDVWLSIFEEHNTIPMLLKLAYHGMILVVDEMESQTKFDNSSLYNIMVSPYAENAMYFMIALSNIPQAAKSLQIHGVMDLLCNNALSSRLEQGKLDIFVRFGDKTALENTSHISGSEAAIVGGTDTAKAALNTTTPSDQTHGTTAADLGISGSGFVERHPLHVLWCQMLNVVSNMIRIVGDRDDTVLRHGVLFIQQYSGQVDRSFGIANGANDSRLGLVPSESMSSPLLTEIEWLTTIMFCLAKQLTRVASFAANIFMAFKNCGLPLVRRYLYHLTHPNHMQAQLFPVDQDEKYQSQSSINNNNTSSSSSSSFVSSPSPQTTSINNEHSTSQLMYFTTQRFIRVTRNILGSIVLLTDAQTILIGKDHTWPFGNTILSPDTQTNSSTTISFGIMKEWIMACLQLTQKTTSWISEHQQKHNIISSSPKMPSQNDLQALLCTLEFSIVLLTSQTILWIAKPDIQQDERKMIASDNLKSLVNLMDKMNTTLKKLEPELQLSGQMTKDVNIKDELKMIETHVIGPLKHLLITRFFGPAQ